MGAMREYSIKEWFLNIVFDFRENIFIASFGYPSSGYWCETLCCWINNLVILETTEIIDLPNPLRMSPE